MTPGLLAAVLGIAVVDSVNPSALAMTGYLLRLEDPWGRIAAYIAAIFTTYLALGLLVVFLVGDGVARLVETLERPGVGYALQGLVGIVALVFAVRRPGAGKQGSTPLVDTPARAFWLGTTITAVEATTAIPYLGALALLVNADASVPALVAALVAYNLVFVAPPVVLTLIAYWRREEVKAWLRPDRPLLGSRGRTILRVLSGVVGVVLLVDTVAYVATGDGVFGW